jgi:ATPases of the AAA+ class
MSVLLFGPPGTAKTTIVKAVADGLGWPVVFLSPGTFIERGLEYIEASARDVFQRILMLQRCIVMFDECDELFRDRGPSRQSEQIRTITAFVTASMLPKLQDLHDRGKVVVFICTNHFGSLDPAVKRSGRIDHILAVGPPDDVARARIVHESLAALKNEAGFNAAAGHVVSATAGFTRDELIRLCDLIRPPFRPITAVRSKVAALAESFSDGRSITAEDFAEFLSDRARYSFAVLEAKHE